MLYSANWAFPLLTNGIQVSLDAKEPVNVDVAAEIAAFSNLWNLSQYIGHILMFQFYSKKKSLKGNLSVN